MDTNTNLYLTVEATVKDFNGLQEVVTNMLATVKEKDPGTMQYDVAIDEEKRTLFTMERFTDANAFFVHCQNTEPFNEELFSKIEVTNMSAYTAPGVEIVPELKQALAAQGAKFMTFIGMVESFLEVEKMQPVCCINNQLLY